VSVESRGGAAGGPYLNRPPFGCPAGNCQTTQTIPVAALDRREATAADVVVTRDGCSGQLSTLSGQLKITVTQ